MRPGIKLVSSQTVSPVLNLLSHNRKSSIFFRAIKCPPPGGGIYGKFTLDLPPGGRCAQRGNSWKPHFPELLLLVKRGKLQGFFLHLLNPKCFQFIIIFVPTLGFSNGSPKHLSRDLQVKSEEVRQRYPQAVVTGPPTQGWLRHGTTS